MPLCTTIEMPPPTQPPPSPGIKKGQSLRGAAHPGQVLCVHVMRVKTRVNAMQMYVKVISSLQRELRNSCRHPEGAEIHQRLHLETPVTMVWNPRTAAGNKNTVTQTQTQTETATETEIETNKKGQQKKIMTATIQGGGRWWDGQKMNFPFDTSLKLTDVGWSGLARTPQLRGVGCHESHNSHPRWQNKRNKPVYRCWGEGVGEGGSRGEWCGHVCCEWIFVFMPGRCEGNIYKWSCNRKLFVCSAASSTALARRPWQPSPSLPGFHNKLSDNCTNCQGGNAARDSSTVQRFQQQQQRQRQLSSASVQLVRVDDWRADGLGLAGRRRREKGLPGFDRQILQLLRLLLLLPHPAYVHFVCLILFWPQIFVFNSRRWCLRMQIGFPLLSLS